mmetsp:Transcript_1874/g.5851  ORF Transcript_1874/g.5851 Transcript_1874/m.5851 type:complete len:244 (-) Transcript_1874:118-849(-)
MVVSGNMARTNEPSWKSLAFFFSFGLGSLMTCLGERWWMLLLPPASACSSNIVIVELSSLTFITRARIHSSGAPVLDVFAATWSPCLIWNSSRAVYVTAAAAVGVLLSLFARASACCWCRCSSSCSARLKVSSLSNFTSSSSKRDMCPPSSSYAVLVSSTFSSASMERFLCTTSSSLRRPARTFFCSSVAFREVCGGISKHLAVSFSDVSNSSCSLEEMSFTVEKTLQISAGRAETPSRYVSR